MHPKPNGQHEMFVLRENVGVTNEYNTLLNAVLNLSVCNDIFSPYLRENRACITTRLSYEKSYKDLHVK